MHTKFPEPSIYIARKTVRATLMTEEEFGELMSNGGIDPAPVSSDAPVEVGFMVEVPEGECNHSGYSGHLSWVPHAEFLYRHQAIGCESDEPAFLQRLRVEKIQLDQKLQALMEYTRSDGFMNQVHAQRDLLLEQGRVMHRYSTILEARIHGHAAQIEHKKNAVAAHAARQ